MELNITVNGNRVAIQVRQYWSLLDVLRDSLGLTGAKRGCDRGECGSCTVLLDGKPVNACQVLASRVDGGANVATIEGLASGGMLSELQQSYLDEDGGQCGFCTPGMIMSAVDLLRRNPRPSEVEVRDWLEGNLCRCTGYHNIVKAVRAAAVAMGEGGS
jgi:carbon-monoxide dehydrogenase small subunit